MSNKKVKNLFATLTGISVILSGLAGTTGSILPFINSIIERRIPAESRADLDDLAKIAGILLGALAAGGSANALSNFYREVGDISDLYTPHFLPGKNIEDTDDTNS